MSAYVIFVRDRITDPEEFSKYEQSAGAAAAGHALTPLAFYGALDTLEGPRVDFLGYEVDEDLPWHSTISRTRHLYPAAVFEHLFNQVFAQCVRAGLVAGDTQVVDSAPVKPAGAARRRPLCWRRSMTTNKYCLPSSVWTSAKSTCRQPIG